MSFNGIGRIWLDGGASTWVWMVRDTIYKTDYGAQWIMPHPEMNTGWFPNFGTAKFQVDHFQKEVFFSADTGQQYVTYYAFVTNVGRMSVLFSLQGGGNV
jgi:hypothetical protein